MSSVKSILASAALIVLCSCYPEPCVNDVVRGRIYSVSVVMRYDNPKWFPFWESVESDVPSCGTLINRNPFTFEVDGYFMNSPNCKSLTGIVITPPTPSTIVPNEPVRHGGSSRLVTLPTYQLTIGQCEGTWSPTLFTEDETGHLDPVVPDRQPKVAYGSYFVPTAAHLEDCYAQGFPPGASACEDRFAVELRPAPIK